MPLELQCLRVDPQRKAPRWARHLKFEADDAFKGEVLDLSAVGMRLIVTKAMPLVSDKLLSGTLTFEDGSHVRIKVRVRRAEADEVGLEIAEADKTFFEALPKLHESGEHPIPDDLK